MGGHTLPAVIATGTYELCINVSRPDYCEDSGPYLLTGPDDCHQEVMGCGCILQPIRSWDKCDPDYVYIVVANRGGPQLHAIQILIDEDCTDGVETIDRTYTADNGDTMLWYLGAQIPDSYVWWQAGGTKFTVRIPRDHWADCCDDWCYKWKVYGIHQPRAINTADDWIDNPCDCDMYPAEVKKFIEVYKWVPEITGDDITDEIFCEDFEDPCQVMDKWDAVDHGPDGDTWVLSTNRFNSADHSYRNTQHATYMPNAWDDLIFHNGTAGLDVSGMDTLRVDIQHWMRGDFVAPNILDSGKVWYDVGAGWVLVPPEHYYNDWELISFTIDVDPLSPADDKLFLKFEFKADAAFCYEGWYIDDVCIYGTKFGDVEKGYWDFVMDSHSWPQIITGPYKWYCFPEKWTVTEEGHYMVCAWLEALDPCHESLDTYGFEGDLCEFVDIGDILELELDCGSMSITPPSPAFEGDDVDISIDACNIGTLDEEHVQVQTTVNRGEIQPVFFDDVESGPYGTEIYKQYRFGISPPGNEDWHITTDHASSPTHSWMYADPVTKYYNNDVGNTNFGGSNYPGAHLAVGETGKCFSVLDGGSNPSITVQAKWVLALGGQDDYFTFGIHDNSTGYTSFYAPSFGTPASAYVPGTFFTGVQDTFTEISFDYSSLISGLTAPNFDGDDLRPAIMFYSDPAVNSVAPYLWSGVCIDDVQCQKIVASPTVIWQQTVEKELNITECKTFEFDWDNVGVGRYVVTSEIITADADPTNNKCLQPYNVVNIIREPSGITFEDLTGGPSHWMVEGCCGGYLWCGDPVTTTYGNNWDDCLYLLSNPSRDFDCSGCTTTLNLEFDAAYKTNASDVLYIEVSDDGAAWWIAGTLGFTNPSWPAFDSYVIDCLAALPGLPTATTQFRFRFNSNATEVNRGVFLDNIAVRCNPFIFGPDDCTTMDNFEAEANAFGSWFRQSMITQYFCYDIAFLGASWFGDGALEPSYGCYDTQILTAARPWNGAYPDNINCTMMWTLDLPQCFYGYLDGSVYYDTDNNDAGYIEISNNGGASYDNLGGYQGSANDDYQGGLAPLWWVIQNDYQYWSSGPWDITDYVGSEVILRWRMEADSSNSHGYAGFGPMFMAFYGMEDTNAPVTTCELVGDIDPVYLYYNDGVAVYLTATDDVTGVKDTWYELDGGPATKYVGPFMVEDDGEHILCYWSVDNVNNVETKKCTLPFRIDQTGPSVTITAPGPGLFIMGNKFLDIENSIHIFGGVQVSADITIAGAPLDVVEFYINDVLFAQDVTAPYEAFCKEKNSGSATFKVVAKDVLDQSGEASITVDTYIKIL